MFDKIKDKIKGKAAELKEQNESDEFLLDWKNKLDEAMAVHSEFRAKSNNWDRQYHDDDSNAFDTTDYMSRGSSNDEEVEGNVNITMQLIEGSIDIVVPKPAISAIEASDGQENRKMIEGMLTYMSEGSQLQKIVSENERITKKNGMSYLKVVYNPEFNGHTYQGKIETRNPHPTNIIPQPNVRKIEDMDYIFEISNSTVEKVCRENGEELRALLEDEAAEFGYLDDFGNDSSQETDDMVSVVECYYKDKDKDIGLIVWANDTIIRNIPKFYYPRDESGGVEYKETLEIENPANVPIKQDGDTQFDESGEVATQETNTIEVERRVPKVFPYIVWYNVPKEKSVYGVSDCQMIKRQQDSIQRMITKEERKQNKGTTKIITKKGSGLIGKIKDAESQILETDDPVGDVKVIDMKSPNQGAITLFQLQMQAAKDLIGVTEASQGRANSSSQSGAALEQLTANTAARMNIKTNEKYIAFRALYQLFYEFLIAYYDDKVPFRSEGSAEVEYGYFDKSALVKQDADGTFYYPDFDIYINADAGMAQDKTFMIQIADKAMEQGAADAIDYWTIMSSINMPNAQFILERARERQQQQQAQAQEEAQAAQDQQAHDNNLAILKQQGSNGNVAQATPEDAPQEQPQQDDADTESMANIISQLDPEEQKQFFESDLDTQHAMLNSIRGGNN